MKLSLKIKLKPNRDQFTALNDTMKAFNRACNFIAGYAFENKTANKVKIQQGIYYEVREKFGLSAQMTIRAISKVAEAYKRNRHIRPKFRLNGAMVYDQRILSWKGLDKVSILTLGGREIIPTTICNYHRPRLDRIVGQADLILVKRTFYLCVIVDCPEPDTIEPVETLGIDMGIVNLAVDSDGEVFSGNQVDVIRGKIAKIKGKLQKCGTKSAKRHLKKLKGKEARFRRNTNHIISKKLVKKAKDTGRRLAIEDLKGISKQTTVRRNQRSRHHSWGFCQLRSFIEYKAKLKGVPVIAVDPRYTSQTCPSCGHISKKNRKTRDIFKCVECGIAGSADHIAAINIAARANVNTPIVAGSSSGHLSPQLQAPVFRQE